MKKLLALLLCLACAGAFAAQEIKPFVRGSQSGIVAARHGKPFILTFWSLTCTYCRDELALLGRLSKKYPALEVVTVATDTPGEVNEIAQALRKYRLGRAEAWVFADSYTERLRFEVDASWYGELPRTYFYDAQGRAQPATGRLEREQIERWIAEGAQRG